jgi:hypothetical protein
MLSKIAITSTFLAALAAAAPKPQVAGYSYGDASFSVSEPTGSVATVFGPDSQILVCILYHLENEYPLTASRPARQCWDLLRHGGAQMSLAQPATVLTLVLPPPLELRRRPPLWELPSHLWARLLLPLTTTQTASPRTPCPFPTPRLVVSAQTALSPVTR